MDNHLHKLVECAKMSTIKNKHAACLLYGKTVYEWSICCNNFDFHAEAYALEKCKLHG